MDPPSQGIVESEELKFFEDRNISDDRNTGNMLTASLKRSSTSPRKVLAASCMRWRW